MNRCVIAIWDVCITNMFVAGVIDVAIIICGVVFVVVMVAAME